MAKSGQLPGFFEKRKILFGKKTSAERIREAGVGFMEAERYDDALEFLARCGAMDLVRKIADIALQRGDTPLFMRAKRILTEPTSEQEWDTLARNALDAGMIANAYVAMRQAGKQEQAEELKRQMPGAQTAEQSAPDADRQSDQESGSGNTVPR